MTTSRSRSRCARPARWTRLPPPGSTTTAASLDWNRIRQKVDRTTQTYRRGVRRSLLTLPLSFALCVGLATVTGFAVSLAPWAVVFGGYALLIGAVQVARLRQLRALAAQRDVIGAWRAQLDGNLRVWRTLRVLAPLAVLGVALQLPTAIARTQAGLASGRFTLVVGAVMVLAMTGAFVNGLRLARTARRELAELR